MTRYAIEEINGHFYISLAKYRTREGQPERVAVYATLAEAEAKIAEWMAT